MRQPPMVIHKGKREEKYEIYVEDYVISFLKEKADSILFYGQREKNGRRYMIYGAGQNERPAVFDKYDLLEEIGCRMERGNPVFLVREENGIYEVKGYKIFYYENEEMQDYLIQRRLEQHKKSSGENIYRTPRNPVNRKGNPHYAITLQLGLVFVVLVAIVINSENSYQKMKQLNQSAAEVFFVMENQEADEMAESSKENRDSDIIVERKNQQDETLRKETLSEDMMLQDNVLAENQQQGQSDGKDSIDNQEENKETDAVGEDVPNGAAKGQAGTEGAETDPEKQAGTENADGQPETDTDGSHFAEQNGVNADSDAAPGTDGTDSDTEYQQEEESAGVEALSRNVTRYYEVERGDTLYMISQKIYGDTSHVKRICEINQITNPDTIRYGQKIILP